MSLLLEDFEAHCILGCESAASSTSGASNSGLIGNSGFQLWLGGELAARNHQMIQKHGITHILNCASEIRQLTQSSTTQAIKYLQLQLDDHSQAPLTAQFERCFEFLDEARNSNGHALVHCAMGISRSASVVIAYLMRSENMDLRTALAHVRKRRPLARPNVGFMQQLCKFECQIRGIEKSTISFREYFIEWTLHIFPSLTRESVEHWLTATDGDYDKALDVLLAYNQFSRVFCM